MELWRKQCHVIIHSLHVCLYYIIFTKQTQVIFTIIHHCKKKWPSLIFPQWSSLQLNIVKFTTVCLMQAFHYIFPVTFTRLFYSVAIYYQPFYTTPAWDKNAVVWAHWFSMISHKGDYIMDDNGIKYATISGTILSIKSRVAKLIVIIVIPFVIQASLWWLSLLWHHNLYKKSICDFPNLQMSQSSMVVFDMKPSLSEDSFMCW